MRPRQLIMMCNEMSKAAMEVESFPKFIPGTVVNTVKKIERPLANEVINSYKSVYKKLGHIVDAMVRQPIMFKGNFLDKIAPITASEWQPGHYSPLNFRELLTELGIIGRVRHWDKGTNIVTADFQYTQEDRLFLQADDDIVAHPMFFERFRIKNEDKILVYPFPKSPEYDVVIKS